MAYIEERMLPADAGRKPKKSIGSAFILKESPRFTKLSIRSKSKAIFLVKKVEDVIREGRLLPRND